MLRRFPSLQKLYRRRFSAIVAAWKRALIESIRQALKLVWVHSGREYDDYMILVMLDPLNCTCLDI